MDLTKIGKMLPKNSDIYLPLFLVLLSILFWRWTRRSLSQSLNSLPGPLALPIIGNAYQMPRSHEWVTYAEWGRKYGPVFQARVFGHSVIIINSLDAAIELLDKRSFIYSDRPRLVMAGELMGWDKGVTLIESGERHRKYRKLLQSTLSKLSSRQFHPLQQQEAYAFARRLLQPTDDLQTDIRRTIAASIVRISYGHTITSSRDQYVVDAENAQAKFSMAATPNVYLVDSLPFLKWLPPWLPGAKFRRDALQWRRELEELARWPFMKVKRELKMGIAAPSYVSKLQEELPIEDEESIMFSALSLYTGGADTTVSSVHTFFLAMTLCPSVQAKAQAELDKVVGDNRLPTFADRDNLPYINACVKEVFRWNPALPLGVAHRNRVADEYKGCLIPAGSTIITNIWAMMQDESLYKDPSEFLPERWLTEENDSIQHNFGFGRRICPGMWTADASVFIIMATILAIYNITPPTHFNGEKVWPKVKYTTGMISHPEPFDVCIKPRTNCTSKVDLISGELA